MKSLWGGNSVKDPHEMLQYGGIKYTENGIGHADGRISLYVKENLSINHTEN